MGIPSNFTITKNGSAENYSWNCNSGTKNVACTANYAPFCGDGSRNATELCDPNDPNKV